jgi:CheY-like chemotaxis protein
MNPTQPTSLDEECPPTERTAARAIARQRARILVVDDDADMREILVAALTMEGYDVLEASSGAAAVERIEALSTDEWTTNPVDLLVTDVRMPDVDGLSLTRKLRGTRWPIPVVMISAFPSRALRAEASALHAVLLPKPFRMDSLRRIVALALPHRSGPLPVPEEGLR